MKRSMRIIAATLLTAVLAACVSSSATGIADTTALRARVALLEVRAQRLQDINDIKRLQRAYGYYLDEGQWDEVAQLFSDQAQLEIGKDGIYRGREHIRAYFRAMGKGQQGLAPGRFNEHLQVMAVITPAGDGRNAMGTWRDIQLLGQLGKDAYWGEGPPKCAMCASTVRGRSRACTGSRRCMCLMKVAGRRTGDTNAGHFVDASLKPDAPPSIDYKDLAPVHTRRPSISATNIRGSRRCWPRRTPMPTPLPRSACHAWWMKPRGSPTRTRSRTCSASTASTSTRDCGARPPSLLTEDAELEIQGKGIYSGQPRVLQYLRAIGPEGTVPGRLYDHMLLQPLTSVDATGNTARARWHLFAQLAKQGEFAEWETGVYENEYRRENGRVEDQPASICIRPW